jgi:hypothetical protein
MLDVRSGKRLAMGSARRKARGSRPARAVAAMVAAAVCGLLAVACSPSSVSSAPGTSAPSGRSGATAHPAGVISLNAISTLRSLFNRADGHTRLVLIFSPT